MKKRKEKKTFKIIEENGKKMQLCLLCKKYKSPVITNGKFEVMSLGLYQHLKKSHKI